MNAGRIAAMVAVVLTSTSPIAIGAPLERGTLALPRPAQATDVASTGNIQWVSRTSSLASELIAIDTTNRDAPGVVMELEVGAVVSGLLSNGEFVFASTGRAREELWVIEGATGRVVAKLDLPNTRRVVRIEWTGPDLVKVSKSRGPGPEEVIIDVSDPTNPLVLETINTGRKPAPVGGLTIEGYPEELSAVATVAEGVGTLIYYVLIDARGTDFRVVERRIAGFPDANGDGVWRVACLGDSNTATFQLAPRKWCEYLQDLADDALFETVNISHRGATVNPQTNNPTWEDAFLHTAVATQAAVDAIVSAYGTNDLLQSYSPTDFVEAHRQHAATAASGGIPVYYAATAPIIGASSQSWSREANDLLRLEFPERSPEFFEGFVFEEHHSDGLHLNDAGQHLRAERAWEAVGPQ